MLTIVIALALVAAACADGALQVSAGRSPTTTEPGTPGGGGGPNTTTTIDASGDADDETMVAAFEDVERFWEETFPDVYGESYTPLSGGLHPYGPDTEVPDCGGPTSYRDVAGNAFYCPAGDFIAWDTTTLIPDLLQHLGRFSLAVVMAHEMAHAIQARAGVPQRTTILLEQMADCFAGAWTDWAQRGGAENFDPSPTDLDKALAGMLELRDPLGVDPAQPGAHGTAFDRIGAFQDGYGNGAETCAGYELDNLEVIDVPFGSIEDFQRGGDWPFEGIGEWPYDGPGERPGIEDFVLLDLIDYWTTVFPREFGTEWDNIDEFVRYDPDETASLPECPALDLEPADYAGTAFYCSSEDFAAWDETELMPELYNEIGDMAVGSVIAEQYSQAAQHQLGIDGDPFELNQQADCLTGTWLSSVYSGDRASPDRAWALSLSPGDLDEAVISYLRFRSQPGESSSDVGTAFERTTAMRDGFLNGIDRCLNYVD